MKAEKLTTVELAPACTCGELKPGYGHKDRCPTLTSLVDTNGKPKIAPVQGYVAGIPWSIQLRAYDAYCAKWSSQTAMIDLDRRGCRGGFGTEELDDFVPGWREEVSEIAALKKRIAELEAAALDEGRATEASASTAKDQQLVDQVRDAVASLLDHRLACLRALENYSVLRFGLRDLILEIHPSLTESQVERRFNEWQWTNAARDGLRDLISLPTTEIGK